MLTPSYLRNNFVFSSILKALVDVEDPDVLVLVETKLQDKDVAKVTAKLRNVMSSNVYPTVEFVHDRRGRLQHGKARNIRSVRHHQSNPVGLRR